MVLPPLFVEHWLWWLLGAFLWVEIACRLLASVEADIGRRAPLLIVLVVGVLWPTLFLFALIRAFLRLPRRWSPPEKK